MKKITLSLLALISLCSVANAEKYIISFDNVQKVKKIECIKGLYYVVADVDDNINERIPLYKLVNDKEVQATCSKPEVKPDSKQETKITNKIIK